MTTTREQLLALAFAALMVLSVGAGTIVLSNQATAADEGQIERTNPGFYTLDTGDDGDDLTMSWSTDRNATGDHSVHITSNGADTDDYGKVVVPAGFELEATDTLSWQAYRTNDSDVPARDEVFLYLDEDDDGAIDTALWYHYGGSGQPTDTWLTASLGLNDSENSPSNMGSWRSLNLTNQATSTINITDYYSETIEAIGLAAGSPSSSDVVDVYVDDLRYNGESMLDDDTGTLTAGLLHGSYQGQESVIQDNVDGALPGTTVEVESGTYETSQVNIDEDLTIVGVGESKPVIAATENLSGDDASDAWVLVESGVSFEITNAVLDGDEHFVYQALRSHGTTTVDGVDFRNIQGSESGGPYRGMAVQSFGGTVEGGVGSVSHGAGGAPSSLTVTDSTFEQIGRIGILVKGNESTAEITGNTYTGKGDGDFLDYAIEVGGGGSATISGNTITDNRGVAASDGSTSAGILATTHYGTGTSAEVEANNFTDNTAGIAVGFNSSDTSTMSAHENRFAGNEFGVTSTAPTVDAARNYWGSDDGPDGVGPGTGANVSANVTFDPWYENAEMTTLSNEEDDSPSPPSISTGDDDDDEQQETPTPIDDEPPEGDIERQTTKDIADEDPDTPGTTVTFDEEESSVNEITFADEDSGEGGSVTVTEYSEVPEELQDANGNDVVFAVDISVPEDRRDSPADVTMTLSQEQLGDQDPEDAQVAHRTDDGEWELLETEIVVSDDGEVTLTAETDGFSVFGVAFQQAEEPTATPGGDTPAPATATPAPGTAQPTEPVEEPAGFDLQMIGLVVALVLVVIGLFALARRRT